MSVTVLMQQIAALLDVGILTKPDEMFAINAVAKFEQGKRLSNQEISRLREIVTNNT
jgi:hypothetical protein